MITFSAEKRMYISIRLTGQIGGRLLPARILTARVKSGI
jgi:hypothetical protein